MDRLSDRGSIPLRSIITKQIELLIGQDSIQELVLFRISKNKGNGIVYGSSDIQCRYFYGSQGDIRNFRGIFAISGRDSQFIEKISNVHKSIINLCYSD